MQIFVKRTNEKAVLPFQTHQSDFCYDLVAVEEEEIAPNVWKYKLGWAMQIDRSRPHFISADLMHSSMDVLQKQSLHLQNCPDIKLSLDLRPRSSIHKKGMVLANSTGTVDEGYTDEISVVMYHVFPHLPRYAVGDTVAQMKIGLSLALDFTEVDVLADTSRGTGGYGSTDKK